MQSFQERYVLLVDTSEMDSARSDISETVAHEFVRRPGSGRRKQHTPWRSPWDASVCTVFASLPASCSPLKPGVGPAGAAAMAAAADCLTPCSLAPTPGAGAGARRGKGKQELCGPCCHCGATSSPQWRKGPKGKPILCNACGIRFLRTRSLGKVTPKKRRSPAGVGAGAASAKRLKLEDDDSDADEGRTSSGVEDALEEAPPPDAETEEPTDELQEDMMALHSSLQAAAAAVKLEASVPRPAGSAAGRHDDDGGAAAAAAAGSAAAFVAAIKQQQAALMQQRAAAQQRQTQLALLQQLQQVATAQRGAAAAQQSPVPQAAPMLSQPLALLASASPAVLQALGFGAAPQSLSPMLHKREGQGSAPSSPLVTPLTLPPQSAGHHAAGSFPPTPASALASTTTVAPLPALNAGLDASLRLLLAGMMPGGALAAAGADDPSMLVQRSRSRGPATSGKTA